MLRRGTIHWNDIKKSCGFIIPDDNSKRILFMFHKLGSWELMI